MQTKKTLKSEYPLIAKEWHPTKNGMLLPSDVAPFSNKKCGGNALLVAVNGNLVLRLVQGGLVVRTAPEDMF